MSLRLNLFLVSCSLVSLLAAQNDQRTTGPVTTLQFQAAEHDFGWVLQDSKNIHVFTFTNTGSEPLIIESAVGSCGCTVPDYTKAPILPGAESRIEVVYSPGKQEGHQEKTVTIIANTKPERTVLRIHAEVLLAAPGVASEPYIFEPLPPPVEDTFIPIPSMAPTAIEPIQEGPATELLFEAMEHDFGQVLQGSENPHVFKFRNTGDVPLLISKAVGSCGCTVPFYAKDPILPGEESEIHIVYKPGKQQGQQFKTVTITANTDPIQTVLRISADVLVVDSVTDPSLFMLEAEYEEERAAIEAVSPGCFVLFPNPTSNELRLDLKEHIGKSADVRIQDTTGRDMLRTNITHISSETSRLDVSSFPAKHLHRHHPGGRRAADVAVLCGEPVSGFGRHQDEAMHR
ncbi:MAG: DUF1573 domain-containing protein [Flavobacteriales bacterium]|nr:DUF1573 domain-containing protein [Flavobacteriales bacterium]